MTKYTSIKSFLSDRRKSDPDTGGGASCDSKSDCETVLTKSVLTDDEDAIDTTMMDFEEIESLRSQDPFMYHSIVQYQRRSLRSRDLDYEDDRDPGPIDAFERLDDARLTSITTGYLDEVTERIQTNSNLSDDVSAPRATVSEQQLPPQQLLQPRRCQSLHPSRIPSTHRIQRRFSQSCACFTTGVVTRQRRVTTECHSSLIIANSDVLSELRNLDVTSSFTHTLLDDEETNDLDNGELDALFNG